MGHWEQHQLLDKGPVPGHGREVVCDRASRQAEICSSVNHVILPLPGYSPPDLQLLVMRRGGLLVESPPSALSPDLAEMMPGKSSHLLRAHCLIFQEQVLILLIFLVLPVVFGIGAILDSCSATLLSLPGFW